MKKNIYIPVNTPLLKGNEKKYLNHCINSNWISSGGNYVVELEKSIAKKLGRKHAVAVSSGTAALDIAVTTLDLKKNDEIILPTFTIISCIHQIIRLGLKPIFIDCDKKTWNMDERLIEKKITKRTKAILVVHIYGLPVNFSKILRLAKKYKLKIIEDSAEVLGLKYKKKFCGNLGDISTLSFYPNKHITTGEGGMLLTDNSNYAKKFQSLRNLCFEKKRFIHNDLGWNYRLSNLHAAVGMAQFEKLDTFIKKKREIGKLYNSLFKKFNFFDTQPDKLDYAKNIYWVYGIVLKKKYLSFKEIIIRELKKSGIETRPFFYPLHLQPILKKKISINGRYPNAENLYKSGFYIPSGLGLKNIEIRYVAKTMIKLFKKIDSQL
ncbi:DegT/DnrJ/EryC1/StrS family aminotransferase [Candidatus Pelagibacter sp.]|jgi:perosamine synthetase|nr:DegT/DnrJ/EryC1/StrS family aminotransferase [Candidatus Pelagibacter sp.]